LLSDVVKLLHFVEVHPFEPHNLLSIRREYQFFVFNLVTVYVSFQSRNELSFHFHLSAEPFSGTLVRDGHLMFLVDGVVAEKRVATKIALDLPGAVKGDKRTEGEIITDFFSFQAEQTPLGPNQRKFFAFDALFRRVAAGTQKNQDGRDQWEKIFFH
jgi:hypothetical protein